MDAIDQEQFSPDPGWYDDVDLFDLSRCEKKPKKASSSPALVPANLKPYSLEILHGIAKSPRYHKNVNFVERDDGKNDPKNVGMDMEALRSFISHLTPKQFHGYSFAKDQPKADVYKQKIKNKRHREIVIYFKFYIEWVVDEYQLWIVSLHEDESKKNEAVFVFEDDWLFWETAATL